MSRKTKIITLLVMDSILITFANLIAYVYMKPLIFLSNEVMFKALLIQLALYLILGKIFKVFTRINRYTSLKELVAIFYSLLISYLIEMIYFIFSGDVYSQRYIFFIYLLSMFAISSSRVSWKIVVEFQNSKAKNKNKQQWKNTIIVGAGAGGGILLNTLTNSMSNERMNVVGLVDDAKDKVGTLFYGSKVLGTTNDLPKLIDDYNVENVTIAIPSLQPRGYERILDILDQIPILVNSMPSIEQIVSSDSITKLRQIDVTDLLGRAEVNLDMDSISTQLMDKTILVTGAGGSIGSELCRQVICFNPKQLILVGHGENSIYLIEKELKAYYNCKLTEIIPVIADIQDRERIFKIVKNYQPDIIYHAAAHKHVPLMEHNPTEAVKNNIFGTKNVAEAAKKNSVGTFVMISTDKANNPPNVMGATKRIAEMIVTSLNQEGATRFSAVRFGNVLGSRGSVVPLFKEQIESGGPITLTDRRMTRYFMTIPEASRLVIQAGALAIGGEIFILDMGNPVKISELALKMIKLSGYSENEIKIIETGIRPGEKLYEELLVDKEKSHNQIHDKIFVGNISGFCLSEVDNFLKKLSINEKELSEQLIKYAKDSSKE